jgi:hypothetical protein
MGPRPGSIYVEYEVIKVGDHEGDGLILFPVSCVQSLRTCERCTVNTSAASVSLPSTILDLGRFLSSFASLELCISDPRGRRVLFWCQRRV